VTPSQAHVPGNDLDVDFGSARHHPNATEIVEHAFAMDRRRVQVRSSNDGDDVPAVPVDACSATRT
jgi:hypothetical protein